MRSDDAGGTIRVTIPGTPGAVSRAVARLVRTRALAGLTPDDCGTAEIVLAEVLNNVVEHAYAGTLGEIEITLRVEGRSLCCTITDSGSAMPDERLPNGAAVTLTDTDMPEGGFGWNLIRALARDLDYSRQGGRNVLSFGIPLGQ